MLKAWAINLFRLTRREYFADFFITPPLTVLFAALSIRADFSLYWPPLFLAGVAAWTFYEYALHRWLSHKAVFLRDVHELHHSRQRDYVAVHPAMTIAIYGLFWFMLGARSSAFMSGFSAGYVAYSILHTAFHYAEIGVGHPLFAAKRRHALHHKFETTNFGVLTGLWDRVFGTESR